MNGDIIVIKKEYNYKIYCDFYRVKGFYNKKSLLKCMIYNENPGFKILY